MFWITRCSLPSIQQDKQLQAQMSGTEDWVIRAQRFFKNCLQVYLLASIKALPRSVTHVNLTKVLDYLFLVLFLYLVNLLKG